MGKRYYSEVKAIAQDSVNWIRLAHDRDKQGSCMNTVMKLRVPESTETARISVSVFHPCSFACTNTLSLVGSLVNTNWEGLGRNRSHSGSRYITGISGGTVGGHDNCQYGRLGDGILNGDFGMSVGSVSACDKLLCEVRNSLLQ